MSLKQIGALSIGQSPRPDLVSPLRQLLPENYSILEAGAMDGLQAFKQPALSEEAYPLSTRLRDGTPVIVTETYLAPRLQKALDGLEKQGVIATLLLCTGAFPDLRGQRPIIKPFHFGIKLLQGLGMTRIGLITPVEEQIEPLKQRWKAAGFAASVWRSDISGQDEEFRSRINEKIRGRALQAIVLDYFGYPAREVQRLQKIITVPVFDLGQLAQITLTTLL